MTGVGQWTDRVDEHVRLHQLQARRELSGLLPLRQLICRLRPNVILSAAMRLNVALQIMRPVLPSGIRFIVREGNLLSLKLLETNWPRLWRRLVSLAYPRADRIIAQCEAMADDLAMTARVSPQQIVRIYNPVDFDSIDHLAADGEDPFGTDRSGRSILAVGSFKAQKGFQRLLQAFANRPPWLVDAHLWILGDGELRESLEAESRSLGLSERVHMPGIEANPFVWMQHADLFVITSYYEGLPNVLLEAIACRCPVVAVDCPGGTREIMTICGLERRLVPALNWESQLFETAGLGEARANLEKVFSRETIIEQYERQLLGWEAAGRH
jgi:glycosyltransferase involved in cell wall biosynthesis